jgi:hypothetical protein
MTPVSNSAAKDDGVEPREDAAWKEESGESPKERFGCRTGWIERVLSLSVASRSPGLSGECSARTAGFEGSDLLRGEPL